MESPNEAISMQELLDSSLKIGPKTFIKAIRIEALFGRQSQILELAPSIGRRLGILYGFNGSGKTTILKLVDSLLANSVTRRKSAIFRIPFRSCLLELSDGSKVGYRRPGDDLTGPFEFFIDTMNQSLSLPFPEHLEAYLQETPVHPAPEIFMRSRSEYEVFTELSNLVQQLPNVVVLPADRNTEASTGNGRAQPARSRVHTMGLQRAIDKLLSRLQLRARRDSNAADSVAFDVFSNIVRNVASGHSSAADEDIGALIEGLKTQISRINTYAEIGLTTPVDADPLVDTLLSVRQNRANVVRELMTPYLQSQEAKLKSLDDIYRIVRRFSLAINSFYHNKTVALNLLSGLAISYKGGEPIQPGLLSSGERQLLLLFSQCSALEPESNIVLIDEPELSLNSEWIRTLLRQLLNPELTGGAQFIMATHSIELLAQYEGAVLELLEA